MWTLLKPSSGKAYTEDVDNLIQHCRNLNNAHKLPLSKLYRQYDGHSGYATDAELSSLNPVKDIIKGQYETKMTGAGTLQYIRRELMSGVPICPMCGINESNTLDHYMDKGVYGQLACFRMNLVPCCGYCNNKKSDKPYSEFIHAYYDRFPDVDFFITKITIKNNRIGLRFSIDKTAIGNKTLADKTEKQFVHLNLNGRLHKAGIMYVHEIVDGIVCKDDRSLKDYLKQRYEDSKISRKRNHWKTSILRGLIQCNQFTMEVVQSIRSVKRNAKIYGDGA